MTDLISLRRSPRTLLERDGHPGPGPGKLGLVLARLAAEEGGDLVGHADHLLRRHPLPLLLARSDRAA